MLDTLVAIADNAVLRITPIINAIVAASLIIFVGFIGGKILGKFILRLLKDSYVDETTKKITKKEIPLAKIASTTATYLCYAAGIIIAFLTLNILHYVVLLIALLFILVIGISAVFGLRDLFPNLRARKGILKKIKIGDDTSINRIQGKVVKIGILETHLLLENGDLLVFPNHLVRK